MHLQISADCRQTRSSASCHCSIRVDPPTSAEIAKCVGRFWSASQNSFSSVPSGRRMAVAVAWLSVMPDLLLLLRDDGHMAPVPMRPSFTGARVEIISERRFWVTSATFGLGSAMFSEGQRTEGHFRYPGVSNAITIIVDLRSEHDLKVLLKVGHADSATNMQVIGLTHRPTGFNGRRWYFVSKNGERAETLFLVGGFFRTRQGSNAQRRPDGARRHYHGVDRCARISWWTMGAEGALAATGGAS